MAEHKQKKARYEKTQDQMSSPPPDIAADEPVSSEVAVKSLHDHSQEEEESTRKTTTSINYFDMVRLREICRTSKSRKIPNIFRDYYLEVYYSGWYESHVDFLTAGDIILVIVGFTRICPYHRDGEFSPLIHKDGTQIVIMTEVFGKIVYNNHNNSVIIVERNDFSSLAIGSLKIESIKAGVATEQINICPLDSNMIDDCDFDIPNCIGMIYNRKDRLFKVFELKNYTTLFTIPREGDDSFSADFRFGSPGNMEFFVKLYNKSAQRREEILLSIYSKLTGQRRKRISIPINRGQEIWYVELCGTDRILLQQSGLDMQIFDISSQNYKEKKISDIQMLGHPYYLYKRNSFLCYTERKGVRGLHVFNLQGEILVTFQDHIYCGSLLGSSHITNAQDIVISLCENMGDAYTINISSILTGECIRKITADTSNCSRLRKSVLRSLLPDSIAYNETTHQIFTASHDGAIYIWSNQVYEDTNNSTYNPISSTDEE